MPQKKVTYFNGRGRGELIRLVLCAGNETFDDERITMEEWPAKKPSTKYGLLPTLTLECGTEMNESFAISKFLAKKINLYGKDDWEVYLIDRALDTMIDMHLKYALSYWEKDEKRKEELGKEFKEKYIPLYLQNLTKYVEEGKGEFLAGANPSLADIYLIIILDMANEHKSQYSKLDNIYKQILTKFPGIKKHLETRPETPF